LKFKNRFSLFLIYILVFIGISTLTRIGLAIYAHSDLSLGPIELVKSFGMGFLFDFITALYSGIPILIYLLIVPEKIYHSKFNKWLVYLGGIFILNLLLFNVIAEFLFWEEFGVRFNFIAVDYLVYTHEVIGNIKESYPVKTLLSGIFIIALIIFGFLKRYIDYSLNSLRNLKKEFKYSLISAFIIIVSIFLVNANWREVSDNNFNCELAGNGIYQFFRAFRYNTLDYKQFYKTIPEDQAYANIRRLIGTKDTKFESKNISNITREFHSNSPEKRLNVILIMVESLSGEYIGKFGDKRGLTPNLDKLMDKSLVFSNLYATGTRTVRGMEAVTLSWPPTPGRSILKRPDNGNLDSLGFIFRDRGYECKFIYSGYGYFDNMNNYFSNNGFDIVDEKNIETVTFSNIWGVCDEDLYTQTMKEADKDIKDGKNFFYYLMTTSNHRPYTYPKGKIDLPPGISWRNGTVKYTDFAINDFINRAKRHAWYKDTIFVIVADHCASSSGRTQLWPFRYRIPLMMYCPAHIKPQMVDKQCSQLDLGPTLLGVLGWNYRASFFGNNILSPDFKERALIGNYQRLGYIKGDSLTIIEPVKKTTAYTFDRKTWKTEPVKVNDKALKDCISYYQTSYSLFKKRACRRISSIIK